MRNEADIRERVAFLGQMQRDINGLRDARMDELGYVLDARYHNESPARVSLVRERIESVMADKSMSYETKVACMYEITRFIQ